MNRKRKQKRNKKRGPYKQYVTDPTKSIPDSTKRSRAKRAQILQGNPATVGTDWDEENNSSDGQELEHLEIHDSNEDTLQNTFDSPTNDSVDDQEVRGRHDNDNNDDNDQEIYSEDDESSREESCLNDFLFSDEESEDQEIYMPEPEDPDTVPSFQSSSVNKTEDKILIMAFALRRKVPDRTLDDLMESVNILRLNPTHKHRDIGV